MINDIYLTGFSGQIGTELRKVFFKKNIGITLLGRKEPSLNQNERFIFFDLNKKFNPDFISKEIIVIHLAHDFKKYKSNVNFSGTENLLSFFRIDPLQDLSLFQLLMEITRKWILHISLKKSNRKSILHKRFNSYA